ncbi:MAG: GTP cyclohydrolase I FolE [Acidobacteria bacterium]|nr:GTP cyclohydrolase I FolE [Acidobacteriota bacterium]
MERGIRTFLEGLGPVVSARDLRETPILVARAFGEELLAGYRAGGQPRLEPLPEAPPDALVVVRGIRFVSVCRHHLLPFHGIASVAYLPAGRLAGFSSVARLVDALARRLQIQEELSEQILESLETALAPRGCACLLEATHQCMTCRGALQMGSQVATLRVKGVFEKNAARRREVVSLLQPPPGARWRVK